MNRALALLPVAALAGLLLAAGPAASTDQEPTPDANQVEAVIAAFAEQGVLVDPSRGRIEVSAFLCQRYEPLEYLLIKQPEGKDHEALIGCNDLSAEALNAAMLMLGVEKGVNGKLISVEPAPTMEEVRAGAATYTVERATGDGFYIYVSWEIEENGHTERYVYRAEDLVLNVRRESTYARGKWVYLGSRFLKPHKDAEEFFAAEGEGNLVSLVYFSPPSHLLTGADPAGDDQNVWYPNAWLLPPTGHPLKVIFTREPIELQP
jgi:hypothetical protein